MPEEIEKILESLPKNALAWLVQFCVALLFAMGIYIFNSKLDEIDNKFDTLKAAQASLATISEVRSEKLSDQQLLIIKEINDIKLKLGLLEQQIQNGRAK